jgi:hypothetical protein
MFTNPTVQDFINREIGGPTPISRPPPPTPGYRGALARALLGDVTMPRIGAPPAVPAIRPGRGLTAPLPSEGVNRGGNAQEQQAAGARPQSIGTGASGLTAGIDKLGTGFEGALGAYAANRAQQQAYADAVAGASPRPAPFGASPRPAPFGAALPTFARQPGVVSGTPTEAPGGYLAKVAAIENPSGNPYATSSTGATGKYQFIPSTWNQFGGGGNIHDPAAQDAAMNRFTQSNYNALQAGLGRPPSDGELYLAHQQGAAGALRLLQNPGTPAGELVGSQAISVNGGDPSAPASAFVNKWGSKFGGALSYADQKQDQQQDTADTAISSHPNNTSQDVIPGQQNPHLPGFDPSSVPFTNTPIGPQGMADQPNPLVAALAGQGDPTAPPIMAPGIVQMLNLFGGGQFGAG